MTDENSRYYSEHMAAAASAADAVAGDAADNSNTSDNVTATAAVTTTTASIEDGHAQQEEDGSGSNALMITGLASRMVDMALESDYSLSNCLGHVSAACSPRDGRIESSTDLTAVAAAANDDDESQYASSSCSSEARQQHLEDGVEVERARTDLRRANTDKIEEQHAPLSTSPFVEPPIPATAASVDVEADHDDVDHDNAEVAIAAAATAEAAAAISTANPTPSSSRRGPRLRVPKMLKRSSITTGNNRHKKAGSGSSAPVRRSISSCNSTSPTNSMSKDEVVVEEEAKESSLSEVVQEDIMSATAAAAAAAADGPLSQLSAPEALSSTAAVQVQTGITSLEQQMYDDTKEDYDDYDMDDGEMVIEEEGGIVVSILPHMVALAAGGGGGGDADADGGGAPIVTRTVTTKTTKTVRHRETAVHNGGGTHTTETISTERSAVAATTFPSGANRAAAALSSSSGDGVGGDGGSKDKDKNKHLRPDPPSDALQSFMIADDGGKSADVRMSAVPGEEERSKAWGEERVAFAQRCTLERYDEMEEEDCDDAKKSDSKDGCAASATGTGGSSSPKKSKRRSGIGSMRRSSPSSSTAKAATSPKKELPGQPVPSTSWGATSATKFKTRVGPNYARYGKKEPSAEALYETVCVRMFTSGRRTENIVDVMPLPLQEAFGGGNDDPGLVSPWGNHGDLMVEPSVPDLLVYHVQMPHDAPSMFKPTEDGKGEEAVVYLRPSKRFVDEMTGKKPMSPAAKLFAKWCKTCDTDFAVRSRFKCMALVRHLEAHNLGWVSPYNGKPVLITESGRARKGTKDGIRYVEMAANVHNWGFLAKKGFVSLLPKFKELRLDIGFTIEAQSDHEMPECMLGAFTANFCDEAQLTAIPNDLQKPMA